MLWKSRSIFFLFGIFLTCVVFWALTQNQRAPVQQSSPRIVSISEQSVPQCPACPAQKNCPVGVKDCSECHGKLPPFAKAFENLDWTRIKKERDENKYYSGRTLEEYLGVISKYLLVDVPPAKTTKRPEPLVVDCSKYPTVLTGSKRSSPVKVFDMFMFGFELDLLEARLYELNDAVDIFVIAEGSRGHRGYRKPLFFQQSLERFAPFLHKIVYLVLDDADTYKFKQDLDAPDVKPVANRPNYVPEKWNIENLHRNFIYSKFVKAHGELGEEDLIVHGDLDEVPDGDVVFQMKHCETKLPAGFCPQGYTTHLRFPSSTRDQMCFQPIVFTKAAVENNKGNLPRRFAPANKVEAGMHATSVGSLAVNLYKYLNAPEGGIGPDKPFEFLRNPTGQALDMAAEGKRVCCPNDGVKSAVRDDKELQKYWLPWFFRENVERFRDFMEDEIYLWKDEKGKKMK